MVEFNNEQSMFEITEKIKVLINSAIAAAIKHEGFAYNYEVSVTFTDNEGIRKVNNQYRCIDHETDVLSFPMIEFNKLDSLAHKFSISEEDKNPETSNAILGDIIISLEKAKLQSEEYGHSFEREVAFLTVHSILHLLGYDHMVPEDEIVMIKEQELILSSINLSR